MHFCFCPNASDNVDNVDNVSAGLLECETVGQYGNFTSVFVLGLGLLVLLLVLVIAHGTRWSGCVARMKCLRRRVLGDDGDIDLLTLGARKLLRICCTVSVGGLHARTRGMPR